jgi:FkbM family methyltransferase
MILNLLGVHLISSNGWKEVQNLALQRDDLKNQTRLALIDSKLISLIIERSNGAGVKQIQGLLEVRDRSSAAFRQDLVALVLNDFKTGGTFIEVGACDGLATSNTLLLEKKFGWQGILIEPARVWHEALKSNRNVDLDFRCAWNENGKLVTFAEKASPGRSGIVQTATDDTEVNLTYEVETVTIKRILQEKQQLEKIDFLSVDTEGSELEVLLGFPFELSKPKFICVEHNFNQEKRMKVREYLAKFGYRNFMETESYVDDWFSLHNENESNR